MTILSWWLSVLSERYAIVAQPFFRMDGDYGRDWFAMLRIVEVFVLVVMQKVSLNANIFFSLTRTQRRCNGATHS
jgi:hypothetical protein